MAALRVIARLGPALLLAVLWATACNCGSSASPADAAVDRLPHDTTPDRGHDGAPPDVGTDLRASPDGVCGGSRKLAPVALPTSTPKPTACGPGCKQVVFVATDSSFDLAGDLVVFSQHTQTIGYLRLSTGLAFRIHEPLADGGVGCASPVTDGVGIAYTCLRDKQNPVAPQDLLARYDPAANLETDLACFDKQPPTNSCGPGWLGYGTTGIAMTHVIGVGNCAKADAIFYRFGQPGLENLSQRYGGVDLTHMAGYYAVWTEINPQTGGYNIKVHDTRDGTQVYASPSPRDQLMARTDGRFVVWADSRNDPQSQFRSLSNTDIYRYDIQTQKVALVTNHSAQQIFPDVSGPWVVWEDSRNDPASTTPKLGNQVNTDVYAKHMETGKVYQITSAPGLELRPHVDADRVLYRAFDGMGLPTLFLTDLKVFVAAQP